MPQKKICDSCKTSMSDISRSECEYCSGTSFTYVNVETEDKFTGPDRERYSRLSGSESSLDSSSPSSPARRSHAAQVAVQSANIVNIYGAYLQVIGIITGIVLIIAAFVLSHQSGSSVFVLVGIVFGALFIAASAVQGALFRMIANYVIARLE